MTGRVDEADTFLHPFEERATARGHRSATARLGYVRGRIQGSRGDIDSARDTFESRSRTSRHFRCRTTAPG